MSSVIQRCACEWLVHQTVTHTPAAQTIPPSPLTLFVSLCVIIWLVIGNRKQSLIFYLEPL